MLPGDRRMVSDDYADRCVVRAATSSASMTDAPPLDLLANGRVIARLSLSYRCRLDSTRTFLAVERSEFKLLTPPGQPLVRLEFDQRQAPAAHWHAHGERTALGTLLAATGRPVPHDLFRLHLPAGGVRMRPCLEDFLEFLARDVGVDCVPGWDSAVADGRERWRRRQVRTLIRDVPALAAEQLAALGYGVTPPGEPPAENLLALRGY